jgi:hypothetical protein
MPGLVSELIDESFRSESSLNGEKVGSNQEGGGGATPDGGSCVNENEGAETLSDAPSVPEEQKAMKTSRRKLKVKGATHVAEWTQAQSDELIAHVRVHGEKGFPVLALRLGKTAGACRARYVWMAKLNLLPPDLAAVKDGEWTPEQDEILITHVRARGSPGGWAELKEKLVGKTMTMMKIRCTRLVKQGAFSEAYNASPQAGRGFCVEC